MQKFILPLKDMCVSWVDYGDNKRDDLVVEKILEKRYEVIRKKKRNMYRVKFAMIHPEYVTQCWMHGGIDLNYLLKNVFNFMLFRIFGE